MPYVEPVKAKSKGRTGYVAASAGKGALSGAAKGAAIGSVVPGIGTGVGAVAGGAVGLLKGLFGGKSKAKAADEQMRAQEAALNEEERSRIGRFDAGQSLLQGLQGRGFTQLSPEAAAAIGKQRDMSSLVADPLAGGASGALEDAMQSVEDYGSQYGINKQDSLGAAPVGTGFSAGQPVGGLNGAVNLDDLKNLYKLGPTASLQG